jgi:hypothetical protein
MYLVQEPPNPRYDLGRNFIGKQINIKKSHFKYALNSNGSPYVHLYLEDFFSIPRKSIVMNLPFN